PTDQGWQDRARAIGLVRLQRVGRPGEDGPVELEDRLYRLLRPAARHRRLERLLLPGDLLQERRGTAARRGGVRRGPAPGRRRRGGGDRLLAAWGGEGLDGRRRPRRESAGHAPAPDRDGAATRDERVARVEVEDEGRVLVD